MTERKLFGVVVRAFGLWSIVLGVSAIRGVIQIFGVRTIENYDLATGSSLYGNLFRRRYCAIAKIRTDRGIRIFCARLKAARQFKLRRYL